MKKSYMFGITRSKKCEITNKTPQDTGDGRFEMVFVAKILHVAWQDLQRKHCGLKARSLHPPSPPLPMERNKFEVQLLMSYKQQ